MHASTPLAAIPASELSPGALASLLSRAYADYPVPLSSTAEDVRELVAVHDVDLGAGRVLDRGGERAAIGLVARRGREARLAALGVVPEARRRGFGRVLARALVDGCRRSGARTLELEVLAENSAARALYRSLGFDEVGRLVGFGAPARETTAPSGPVRPPGCSDVREVAWAEVATAWRAVEERWRLPWQRSSRTLARLRGLRTFVLDDAHVAFSASGGVGVVASVWEGAGGPSALRASMDRAAGLAGVERWLAPPLLPEHPFVERLARVGFARSGPAQVHMTLNLERLR